MAHATSDRAKQRRPALAPTAPPDGPSPGLSPEYLLDGALRRPDSAGSMLAAMACIGVGAATAILAVAIPLLGGDFWAGVASVPLAVWGGTCFASLLYLVTMHRA